MTSQKEIINVQNILNGTTESAISAAQELSKIPGILRGFESIGLDKIEITKKDDLQNYLANLDLLGQKAQNAAGHLVTLSSDMSQTANSYKEGLANGTRFNSKLYEQELGMTSLTEAQKKLILQQSGLITSTGKYTIAQTDLVQTAVEGTETFSKLGDAEKQEVTAAIAATTAKQGQKAATESLTAAQAALNVVMGVGKQLLISIAVAGVVFVIQKVVQWVQSLTKSVDELESAAASAKNEYESLGSTLEDYRTQLDDIIAKKKDVRDGKITDPAEITEIDNQNEYIRAQIKLYESLLEEKAKVANQNAWEAANSKDYTSLKNNYSVEDDPNGVGAGEVTKIDRYEALDERIDRYNELSTSLANLSQAYNDGSISQSEYDSRSAALTTQIENLDTEISNIYNDISDNFNSAIDDSSEKYQQLKADTDAATQSYLAFKDATDTTADAADNAADANANFGESTKEVNLDEVWSNLNSQIDEIQSAYSSLMSAMDEYNQYGALSMDTLQSLLTLDDQYLACLVDQNGQLSLNMQSFQDIATARLNDAKATAVQQAMSELHAIAEGGEATAASGAMGALSAKGPVVEELAAHYKNLGDWAAYAAQNEALADSYSAASAVNADAANKVMAGLDAKFALIDSTMLQIQKSASGAGKALGGYGSAARGAGGSAGKAASGVDKLTESLNKQKDAIEENKKALEKQQNKLKIYGQAAIDEIEKRIDALDKEKDAQDAAFGAEKKRLEEMKDAQDKLYDKQIDDLKDKKKALQDANDEEDRAIELAKAQDDLAKAQSQRTKRVYQHDTGFEWQVDESAVSDAQNNLDDKQRAWKREDAINAVEKEIDAIEKLKDAYDEEVEAAIDAIDRQKDAYDDSIDAEIDKLNNMKNQWNETLSLIGTSWEDYQAKLAAAAEFNGMSLEQMYEAHTAYKDNVIANMQAIGEADAQLAEIENQLKEAEEAKNAATDAGTGSTGGAAGATNNYATAADALTAKLDGLALKIAETGEKNDELKQREAELCDQISNGNLTTSERVAAMDELHDVQSKIADNDQLLADLSAQYVEAIANETDVTVGYRQQQMDVLSQLADSYGINYGMVADTLNEYVSNLDTTVTTNEEQFGAIQDTIGIFADTANTDMQNAGTSMTQFQSTLTGAFETCGGSVDSLISKLNSLAETAAQTIQKVAEAKRQAGQGSSAIGSRSIQKTGYYHVDESGQEIVVHDGKPSSGRYTYLERGDQVLPASYSKNLWDMGSNPSEWFEKQYSKFSRLDTKAVYAGGTTVYSPAFSGDIVITNPVGNSDDLARGLKQNLPTSFMQALGVRS